ncbi:MAG: lysylphosphatidylglycerol synthase transmembrane domain-containing protein [Acidimicrobiia bacterium]
MTIESRNRFSLLRVLFGIVALAFAVHLLLPRVNELPRAVEQVKGGSPLWLLAALVTAVLPRLGGTISMIGSIETDLPFWPTFKVQLAAGFTGLFAPQGVGLAAINAQYVEKRGEDRTVAVTASGLNSVAGLAAHVLSMLVAVALIGPQIVQHLRTPPRWWLLAGGAAFALVVGVAVWTPLGRKWLWRPALRAGAALWSTVRRPKRTAQLLGGSLLVTLSNAVTLALTLKAFGHSASLIDVVSVYLVAAAVASIAPTPGALGALEAALIAGLIAVGVDPGTAVGGVLVFRLLTFWLPIIPGVWALRDLRRRGAV